MHENLRHPLEDQRRDAGPSRRRGQRSAGVRQRAENCASAARRALARVSARDPERQLRDLEGQSGQ